MKYKLHPYVNINRKDNITISVPFSDNIIVLSEEEYIDKFNNFIDLNGSSNLDDDFLKVLYDNNIIIDDYNSEILKIHDYMQDALDKTIILTIMPTENCNFRCVYCYEEFPNQTLTLDHYNTIFSFILNKIKENKPEQITIKWFGGEPLLEKNNIINFNTAVKNIANLNNIIFYSNITTNGYLLDLDTAKELTFAGINKVAITIDGLNHDLLRPLKNGEPTLNVIIQNIKNILDSNINIDIYIRCNITAESFDMTFYNLFDNYKIDPRLSFFIRPVGQWGESKVPLNIIPKQNINKYLKKHYSFLKKNNFNIHRNFNSINNDPLSHSCSAAFSNGFVIRGNGDILKCTLDLDKDYNNIGRIDIDNNNFHLDFIKKSKWDNISLTEACNNCDEFLSCYNTKCPRKNIFSKKNICQFNEYYI